ncbi:MAG: hypothetical protein GKR87_12615 [Kiritimatiellae bacterium]|nr:hypothetical protein [Kiritimatiellia bacterium]
MLDLIVLKSLVAGLAASVACGFGALPLLSRRMDPARHTGKGYAFAGGLMSAASVYNLILPGLTMATESIDAERIVLVLAGILLGSLFLSIADRYLSPDRFNFKHFKQWGGKTGILIFVAMSIHSIPEGVAVGVGFASEEVYSNHLGSYIALAIAIHNIPEGLAVAIPLRSAGARIRTCFLAAFLTSLPQPIAAVPASIMAWFFQPIMPVLMGFAAGAMIFLVVLELIPDALEKEIPPIVAWAFTSGFCLMLLVQVVL